MPERWPVLELQVFALHSLNGTSALPQIASEW
jgi:hypothetical protein